MFAVMQNNYSGRLSTAASIRICVMFIAIPIFASCSPDKFETRSTSWPDGSPKEEWTVARVDDSLEIRQGLYQSWHQNGQLAERGSFHSGVKDGLWTIWYGTSPNIKTMEGSFVRGEMNGRWYFWMDPSHMESDDNIEISHDMHMSDAGDNKHDFVHPKPSKFEEYKMGVPHGLSLSRHHNGQVADSFVYVDGKLEGKYISYHPNGQRATAVEYNNGVRVGKQLFWNENGKVVREIE